MPGMSDWLNKLRQYGQNAMQAYGTAGAQAQSLPNELAARTQMTDQGRIALGQAPVAGQATQPMPAPPAQLAPYEHVNPGYAPIGGENALRRTLAGQPPKLR